MKLLIIGCGAIADSVHIPAAIKLLGRENVILAEPDQGRAAEMARKHSLSQVEDDYHNSLESVDACVIATPPHMHNLILKDCIESGKHVLCEKPLSDSSAGTESLLAGKSAGQVLGMCHTCRFYPARRKVRDLIKSGFFGIWPSIEIEHGSTAKWPSVTGYNYNRNLVPGGVLFDMGIHPIDFVFWCIGSPENVEYEDDACNGLEDNAYVSMYYKNTTVHVRISRSAILSNKIDPGLLQLYNFMNAIEGKEQIVCPVEEGLSVVEIVEECYSQRLATAH